MSVEYREVSSARFSMTGYIKFVCRGVRAVHSESNNDKPPQKLSPAERISESAYALFGLNGKSIPDDESRAKAFEKLFGTRKNLKKLINCMGLDYNLHTLTAFMNYLYNHPNRKTEPVPTEEIVAHIKNTLQETYEQVR